jgi:prevent-host-death family protein
MADPMRHEITQCELRNDSGAIMRGVERGESYTITRNGTPIGRLIPLRRRTFVPREQVMATFASAAAVDPDRLRLSATVVPPACSISSCAGAAAADPRFDVCQHPDLALGQLRDGFGEVGPRSELVDPLTAHAEQVADLVRSDEPK